MKLQPSGKQSATLIFFALFIFTVSLTGPGCSIIKPDPKRKVEKKMEKEAKQADKEYEKAKKAHLKNQKKETLKMMKKTKKRADRVNAPKKRGFLSGRKCR